MRRLTLLILLPILGLALGATAAVAAPTIPTVAGSWMVSVTLPPGASNCPAGGQPCVIFAMATATSDGTVIQTPALPGVSNGHGLWRRTEARRFLIKSTYFRFGTDGLPIGTSVTVTTLDLANNGRTGTGTFTNTLFDAHGTAIGSFSGTAAATRMTF